ncbi:MAG: PKD domain-containing protein [Chitinophagaceae bacterium]
MSRFLFLLLLLPQFVLSQGTLNKGLVAWYPFNGNANDESGNNNNAAYINAELTSDRFGNPNSAYLFNGTSNYIRVPNNPSINMVDKITLSAWVKVNGFYQGLCHGNTILMKGDADYLTGNYMLRFEDHAYTRGQNCSGLAPDTKHQNFHGPNAIAPSGGYTPFIETGKWYNVTYTCDGNTVKVYVNCELKISSSANGYTFTNRYDLFLGKMRHAQYPYWFNGVMDDVRIYNRALSESEVLQLCNKKDAAPDPCMGNNIVSAKFGHTISNCLSASFELSSSAKKLKDIQWSFGDGTRSDKTSPSHVYKKYGDYKVKAITTSKTGCTDTFTRDIQFKELRTDFSYSELGNPGNIQFKAKNNNASYSWDFGDGRVQSNETAITHIYNGSGKYAVRMFAENNTGCKDTVEKKITVTLPVLITATEPLTNNTSLPAKTPITLEKRSKDITRTIALDNDLVSISLYDNGIIDGDSITLVFNNEVILTHQLLSSKPLNLSLKIDRGKDSNELMMYAENLGSIPPNTALMIITDGNNRYQVNVSSSKSLNGVVLFTFKNGRPADPNN